MATDKSAERPPATVRDFRLLQVLLLCLLLLGPVFIVTGIHSNYRDRHSLKWPVVRGLLLQAESYITGNKHRSYLLIRISQCRNIVHRINGVLPGIERAQLAGRGGHFSGMRFLPSAPKSIDVPVVHPKNGVFW